MTVSTFEALPLAAPLQRAIADKGYTEPSPIQAQAIPVLLEGRDLLACAQTGTGKTAAFALPILHRIGEMRTRTRRNEVRVLVLTPTRELAVQVAESFETYGKYTRFRLGMAYGGVSAGPQIRALQQGLDVMVATPGRLLDLYEQGHVDLSTVKHFVLDEADRMLDMGFIHDIRRVAAAIPSERQTLLFSATMAPEVASLAASLLHQPEEIRIAPQAPTADLIDQGLYFVRRDDKIELLLQTVEDHQDQFPGELCIVFSRTKHGARKLAEKLDKAGLRADSIHGDKSQAQRQKSLDLFREGRTRVLVATDVAARGIDVRNITLVVNYDVPMEPDAYIHRIGRTARAGATGRAITFCTDEELPLMRAIENLIKKPVPVEADHEFHDVALADRYARGPRGGYNNQRQAAGRSGGGYRGGQGGYRGGNSQRGGYRGGQGGYRQGNSSSRQPVGDRA